MVHVGVSGIAKELTLEQQAHNHGYDKLDVRGCLPARGQCCNLDDQECDSNNDDEDDERKGQQQQQQQRGEKCLVSGLRMGEVCEEVLKDKCDVAAVVSYDPGR